MIVAWLDRLAFRIECWLVVRYARRRARARAAQRNTLRVILRADDQMTPELAKLQSAIAALTAIQYRPVDPRLQVCVDESALHMHSKINVGTGAPRTFTVEVGDNTALEQTHEQEQPLP